jgi:hypothetical protein
MSGSSRSGAGPAGGCSRSAGEWPTAISPGGEFFLRPASPAHRRYEELRAYLGEGLPAGEAAARFGYAPASLLPAVRDFRARAREFFTTGRPGPKTAPAKDAARARIIELRAAGHSIDEIDEALAAEGTPLNRTGIAEVIAAEGVPRMWRRPDAERGPAREIQARAEALDFTTLAGRAETRVPPCLPCSRPCRRPPR